jgi:hypothetical protein
VTGVDLLVPLRDETFSIDGVGTVYDGPPVAGLLEVGLEATIW